MKTHNPTPLQIKAWDTLDALTAENKIPPSMTDLMAETGTTSTSVMKHRLDSGVRVGRIVGMKVRGGTKYVPAWWLRMVNENVNKYYHAA